MAKIQTIHPIASISGAIIKAESTYFRTRNGKVHVYKVTRPFEGQPSEQQNAMRQDFGACVKQAGIILRTPELREEWQLRYNTYLQDVQTHPSRHKKPSSTLRGFIISQLHKKP